MLLHNDSYCVQVLEKSTYFIVYDLCGLMDSIKRRLSFRTRPFDQRESILLFFVFSFPYFAKKFFFYKQRVKFR